MIGGGAVALVALLILGAFTIFGGGSSSDQAASSESTSASADVADNCSSNDAKDLKVSVEPLFQRFDDADARARSTARIALSAVIGEMQAVRRDFTALQVPVCATKAKDQMMDFMNKDVDAYLGFSAQESDSVVLIKMTAAQTAQAQASMSWAVVFGEQIPATTQQAIATPSATPIDACQLITAPQIKSALGGNWEEDIGGTTSCLFTAGNEPSLSVRPSLEVRTVTSEAGPQAFSHGQTGLGDHEVSGLGDGAYCCTFGLDVLWGNIEISVSVESAFVGGVLDEGKSIAIAKIILNNLGSPSPR